MKLEEILQTLNLQSQIIQSSRTTNTKFSLAYSNHNLKSYDKLNKEVFQKQLDAKKLELALTGKDGEVLFDDKGGYKFSKEGYKSLQEYQETTLNTDVIFEFYTTNFNSLSEKEAIFYIKDKECFVGTVSEDMYKILTNIITDLPELKYENLDEATE